MYYLVDRQGDHGSICSPVFLSTVILALTDDLQLDWGSPPGGDSSRHVVCGRTTVAAGKWSKIETNLLHINVLEVGDVVAPLSQFVRCCSYAVVNIFVSNLLHVL